jgi:hypothetical protein
MRHTPHGPTFPFLARVVCVGWGRERIYLHKNSLFSIGVWIGGIYTKKCYCSIYSR